MPADLTQLLTSLGLSGTETKVYLSSLELGPASVQDIAKKARLSRTAAYVSVEALIVKGLMSSYTRGKKRYFAGEDPDSAVAHFKTRISGMERDLETLARALPELRMMKGGERPVVRFFEGKEAIYAIFHDVAKVNPKNMDELSNYDDIYQYVDKEILHDAQKLLDPQQTKLRILHRGTPRLPRSGVEFCQLLPELGNFHGDIWIYENRVAFVTFIGKVLTVIIESEAFAQTARVLFEAAWRICSKSPGATFVGK